MNTSIQHFVENGIPKLEKIKKNFMKHPETFDDFTLEIKRFVLELGCTIIAETLEECNTLLEDSGKRRLSWYIKDRGEKNLLTGLGIVSFTRTRFENKETKETAYLLDRILGLTAHMRISKEAQACLIEEAIKSSYEKAGQEIGFNDSVSRETVMRHVHRVKIPEENLEGIQKKEVKKLYIEADEEHFRLQYLEKKGDVKRWKGYGNNGRIAKLIYIHEGIIEDGKRRRLKNCHFFGGYDPQKENEELWKEVKEYIEANYKEEAIEKIYFQSDGGNWMKKGIEILGAEFVIDEFHLKKYVKRVARNVEDKEEKQKEVEEGLLDWMKKGNKKKFEEWGKEQEESIKNEKKRKKFEKNFGYLKRNWNGIRKRVQKEEGIVGSSTESHVSHVLSARMSARPMGFSKLGASMISRLRIYWKNGRDFKELLKEHEAKIKKEETYFTLAQLRSWEIRTKKKDGKYIDRLQASVSRTIAAKVYFQEAITGIC